VRELRGNWRVLRWPSCTISPKFPPPTPNIAMRTAWVQWGALRALPCIQGEVMAICAWVLDFFAKLSMRATSVHAKSHATHAQHNTIFNRNHYSTFIVLGWGRGRDYSTNIAHTGIPTNTTIRNKVPQTFSKKTHTQQTVKNKPS
jgi:hypothetical protein